MQWPRVCWLLTNATTTEKSVFEMMIFNLLLDMPCKMMVDSLIPVTRRITRAS